MRKREGDLVLSSFFFERLSLKKFARPSDIVKVNINIINHLYQRHVRLIEQQNVEAEKGNRLFQLNLF